MFGLVGPLLLDPRFLELQLASSVIVAHKLSCPVVYGVFPDHVSAMTGRSLITGPPETTLSTGIDFGIQSKFESL